jgi:hypothetical protein
LFLQPSLLLQATCLLQQRPSRPANQQLLKSGLGPQASITE